MADHTRAARLAQRIKVILAEALQKTVKDDRIDNVTLTEARVTNDLQQATVYYTVLGDEDTVASAHQAMEENRGLLRREMGRGWNSSGIQCPKVQHSSKKYCAKPKHGTQKSQLSAIPQPMQVTKTHIRNNT